DGRAAGPRSGSDRGGRCVDALAGQVVQDLPAVLVSADAADHAYRRSHRRRCCRLVAAFASERYPAWRAGQHCFAGHRQMLDGDRNVDIETADDGKVSPHHVPVRVDRRTMSVGAASLLRDAASSLRIRDWSNRTASVAMVWIGWRMVVSGGSQSSENRIPSNPVTLTCSGIATPALRNSRTTPSATMSDTHTTASGISRSAMSARAAARPNSIVNEPSRTGPGSSPATSGNVCWNALIRLRPVELAVSSDTKATVLQPCSARCSRIMRMPS